MTNSRDIQYKRHTIREQKIDFTVSDNWLNDEIVLQHIYSNFLNYWDEAIEAYKSDKAKSKRITYLIETLNRDLRRTEVKHYIAIQQQIKNLIKHYEELSVLHS